MKKKRARRMAVAISDYFIVKFSNELEDKIYNHIMKLDVEMGDTFRWNQTVTFDTDFIRFIERKWNWSI